VTPSLKELLRQERVAVYNLNRTPEGNCSQVALANLTRVRQQIRKKFSSEREYEIYILGV